MEELKSRGNEEVGRGNFAAALKLYQRALKVAGNDARARAVVHSNMSACHLALRNYAEALREGEAAVAADNTFEKGHARCGAALERMPGRRRDALAAYRRAGGNEAAKERIAVLQVERVVGEEGVAGIEEGSLDPRQMRHFANAYFYAFRATPLHELLDDSERPTSTVNAYVRHLFASFARHISDAKGRPLRMVLAETGGKACLVFEPLEEYKQLSDVSDDGRRLLPQDKASVVPILPVGFCTDADAVGGGYMHFPVSRAVLDVFSRMLEANAKLLSDSYKASLGLIEGIRASVLMPVSVDVPQVVVFEKCAFPGCKEEVCKFRCSRCMLVRYCGSEHSTGHWQQHKAACAPASQRPCIVLVSAGAWPMVECLETPEGFLYRCITDKFWPLKPVTGLAIVKLAVHFVADRMWLIICDGDSATGLFDTAGLIGGKESLQRLKEFMRVKGHAGMNSYRIAYCDADLSGAREGRIQLFLDKALNCVW
jgi:hypothetical protein